LMPGSPSIRWRSARLATSWPLASAEKACTYAMPPPGRRQRRQFPAFREHARQSEGLHFVAAQRQGYCATPNSEVATRRLWNDPVRLLQGEFGPLRRRQGSSLLHSDRTFDDQDEVEFKDMKYHGKLSV